jgi:hypothetical protein
MVHCSMMCYDVLVFQRYQKIFRFQPFSLKKNELNGMDRPARNCGVQDSIHIFTYLPDKFSQYVVFYVSDPFRKGRGEERTSKPVSPLSSSSTVRYAE